MFLTLFAGHLPPAHDLWRSVALFEAADSLYFAGRPDAALAICEATFVAGDDDADLRWRATRAALALGMARPDDAERRAFYDRALMHARRGLELAPHDKQTRYWLTAAAGRRAHRSDPVYSARLPLMSSSTS